MDSVDLEVVRTALSWLEAGRSVTLGTIVHTWGSGPRPVGAMVVIRDDGQVVGSVSGGCVEDDLVEKVRAKGVAVRKPETIVYGLALMAIGVVLAILATKLFAPKTAQKSA